MNYEVGTDPNLYTTKANLCLVEKRVAIALLMLDAYSKSLVIYRESKSTNSFS